MITLLYIALFILLFITAEAVICRILGIDMAGRVAGMAENVRKSKKFKAFLYEKQLWLKRHGADIFLSDGLTVPRWYLYKLVVCVITGVTGVLVTKGLFKSDLYPLTGTVAALAGWFFLDLFLKLEDSSSNQAMMPDVMEMSRSVLYAKRGGQFIGDSISDAVIIVENKRLKMALIKVANGLKSGRSIAECMDEMGRSFTSGEIAAFCTVIRSLQSTGQVDEALDALKTNIFREQASINKKRCVVLENKTMMYVMLIAFDILALILYCIIMRLLEMQIAF